MIWERLPATLFLTITALVIWVSIAIVLGVFAAVQTLLASTTRR